MFNTNPLSRRSVLTGLLAAATLPAWAQTMLLRLLDSLVIENEHAFDTGDLRRSGLQRPPFRP
jgi:hypothetical protein